MHHQLKINFYMGLSEISKWANQGFFAMVPSGSCIVIAYLSIHSYLSPSIIVSGATQQNPVFSVPEKTSDDDDIDKENTKAGK